MNEILIKYHVPDMTKLTNIGGAISDWIDLRTAEDVFIRIGEYLLISLGVSMEIPEDHEAIMTSRSSTFKNYGIIQTNGVAIIDEKYCGDNDIWHFPAFCQQAHHVKIRYGSGKEEIITLDEYYEREGELVKDYMSDVVKTMSGTFIPKNTRICQFRLFRHQERVIFKEMETLGNPDRGGIGSTGTK